jgi:hypothetical protein
MNVIQNCNTCEIMSCAGGKACATLKGLRYLIAALNVSLSKKPHLDILGDHLVCEHGY